MGDYLKTFLLLAVLSLLIIFIGGAIGGRGGMYVALIIALVMNGVSYFFSDRIAISSSGAKAVSEQEAPALYQMTRELTRRMKMPMPDLYVIPSSQANAFATGRDPNHAAVAVTEGIMKSLNQEELMGVLAHELGHVKNRDILIATVAATLASVIGFIAQMAWFAPMSSDEDGDGGGNILLLILAPIVATIIQLAISREREFEADEIGAKVLGRGEPLASALIKIHDSAQRNPMQVNPAFSSLYISNPLGGIGGLAKLFSTHPPVEERVARLRRI